MLLSDGKIVVYSLIHFLCSNRHQLQATGPVFVLIRLRIAYNVYRGCIIAVV